MVRGRWCNGASQLSTTRRAREPRGTPSLMADLHTYIYTGWETDQLVGKVLVLAVQGRRTSKALSHEFSFFPNRVELACHRTRYEAPRHTPSTHHKTMRYPRHPSVSSYQLSTSPSSILRSASHRDRQPTPSASNTLIPQCERTVTLAG